MIRSIKQNRVESQKQKQKQNLLGGEFGGGVELETQLADSLLALGVDGARPGQLRLELRHARLATARLLAHLLHLPMSTRHSPTATASAELQCKWPIGAPAPYSPAAPAPAAPPAAPCRPQPTCQASPRAAGSLSPPPPARAHMSRQQHCSSVEQEKRRVGSRAERQRTSAAELERSAASSCSLFLSAASSSATRFCCCCCAPSSSASCASRQIRVRVQIECGWAEVKVECVPWARGCRRRAARAAPWRAPARPPPRCTCGGTRTRTRPTWPHLTTPDAVAPPAAQAICYITVYYRKQVSSQSTAHTSSITCKLICIRSMYYSVHTLILVLVVRTRRVIK